MTTLDEYQQFLMLFREKNMPQPYEALAVKIQLLLNKYYTVAGPAPRLKKNQAEMAVICREMMELTRDHLFPDGTKGKLRKDYRRLDWLFMTIFLDARKELIDFLHRAPNLRARSNIKRLQAAYSLHMRSQGRLKEHVMPATQRNLQTLQRIVNLLVRPVVMPPGHNVPNPAGGVRSQRLHADMQDLTHLQYLIEAMDPKHRRFDEIEPALHCWCELTDPASDGVRNAETFKGSFFEFLDLLEKQNLILSENDMPTDRLTYLRNEIERQPYEVIVDQAILKQGGTPLDTSDSVSGAAWHDNLRGWSIWVMAPDKRVYCASPLAVQNLPAANAGITVADLGNMQPRIDFHHSSFMEGRAVLCGGEWKVERGELRLISMESGHYRPTAEQFFAALREMKTKGLNTSRAAVQWVFHDANSGDITHAEYYGVDDFLRPGVTARLDQSAVDSISNALRQVDPDNPALPRPPHNTYL